MEAPFQAFLALLHLIVACFISILLKAVVLFPASHFWRSGGGEALEQAFRLQWRDGDIPASWLLKTPSSFCFLYLYPRRINAEIQSVNSYPIHSPISTYYGQ